MARRNMEEQRIHQAIIEWMAWVGADCDVHHIPNGGARTKTEAAILKSLGVVAGAPDLHLCLNGGRCAYVEIKKKGERVSPEQIAFRNKCEKRGALWAVCESIEDMERTLDLWGVTTCQRRISR